MGALYQSLGAAYAQMFQFHRAYRAYDKAYGLDHDREVLKRIYFLSVLATELEAADTYGRFLSRNLKAPGRKNCARPEPMGNRRRRCAGCGL